MQARDSNAIIPGRLDSSISASQELPDDSQLTHPQLTGGPEAKSHDHDVLARLVDSWCIDMAQAATRLWRLTMVIQTGSPSG